MTAETTRSVRRFDPTTFEPKWRDRWQSDDLYRAPDDSELPSWFSLTMYPYPSGVLHVGHWYAFAIPDTFARYKRRTGYNVMFPMGFDAFGLPAENAAIKNNIHPATWTVENIAHMREQYRQMGAGIDWSREVVSCDPDFYRWNQWIFLQMLERRLAYRANGAVWWCPHCQTVLANEQVLDGNVCERCGTSVYRRDLEQWYFKITEYADELLAGLDELDWPERVKTMQRNWIGRSEGARLRFELETGEALEVFTTRPDTVWGATFMVMAPEHPLVATLTTDDRRAEVDTYVAKTRNETDIDRLSADAAKPKTGVFTGAYAINPVNDERIPIWIADYVLMGYGTGAIMAVPSGDQRDFEFARAFGLPIRVVVQPVDGVLDSQTMTEAYHDPGVLADSGPFTGRYTPEVVPEIIAWLESEGRGRREVIFRLRDWLISRQRYWGTPIPVVYCDACGIVPVPIADLPVELPLDAEFKPTGQSPLVSHEAFLQVACPTCGGQARRETDTLDTFMDSSWYWFRYTDNANENVPFDPAKAAAWTPVDLYCGGIEHAILHLLYARFLTKVLRDIGLTEHGEPFTRLRNQGMILSEEGVKMSKSRGTQIDPDAIVGRHGADVLRLHLMYLGPWDQGGPWNDRGLNGAERLLKRIFELVATAPVEGMGPANDDDIRELRRLTNATVKRVTEDLDAFSFNTMVAGFWEFSNQLMLWREGPVTATPEWRTAIETLVSLLGPAAPFAAEELWEQLGMAYSIHTQPWPTWDESLLVRQTVEIVLQVNGKLRDRVTVSADATQEDVTALALANERVAMTLAGGAPRKVIYVPGKLVNIVA